jgi:uncharacterized SAM-binding protein YcdF (DUF218 family)
MEILFFDFRKVPFTCSHLPGKVNLVGLSVLYILGFTMYSSTMADLESWLGGLPAAAALFFAVAASACVLLNRWQRRSSERWYQEFGRAATLDYDDPGDPVVRTLGLTQ